MIGLWSSCCLATLLTIQTCHIRGHAEAANDWSVELLLSGQLLLQAEQICPSRHTITAWGEEKQSLKTLSLFLYIYKKNSNAESEPVEPKLFEIRSRNYLFNKYLQQSVWKFQRKKNYFLPPLRHNLFGATVSTFKWQYTVLVPYGQCCGAGRSRYFLVGAGTGVKVRLPAPAPP